MLSLPEIENDMKAIDALTGQTFTKKVATQRFSSRENQRIYNNRKSNERRKALKDYWRVLTHNRDILERTLSGKPERIVSKDFLIGAGYNFAFFTHSGIKEQDKAVGLFDFGLQPLSGDRYKIFHSGKASVSGVETINSSQS